MTAQFGDDQLNGDAESLEKLFDLYEPYLRAIIRRQISSRLRAKFDSTDVVQSVWVQFIQKLGQDGWQVNDRDHLRALLVTIAQRRLIDRVRRYDRDGNDPGADEGHSSLADLRYPSPSQSAQAKDLWSKMLSLTPPEHHQVIILKREGLPLAEIAARTGLHEGSVRRIIRRLSRELTLYEQPLSPSETPPSPEAE
jgi:RNA polymerase sigma factor (sigma-70 family)